jgi:hypothetical protein
MIAASSALFGRAFGAAFKRGGGYSRVAELPKGFNLRCGWKNPRGVLQGKGERSRPDTL